MVNEKTMTGSLTKSGGLSGSVSGKGMVGGVVGGAARSIEGAVLFIEQDLTPEQQAMARKNIDVVGENVTGKEFTAYTVKADGSHVQDITVNASDNAEIFNDYENNIATGRYANASGHKTQAIGDYSKTDGYLTRADGEGASASGFKTRAGGKYSHAEGYESSSTGYYSNAMGLGTISKGQNQLAIGKYNIADTSNVMIVGRGSKDTMRSNAFTLSSFGVGWFASKVTSSGADYAEYFEWADGNQNGEDRIGLIVTLDGEKIRLANADDDILGVVSGTAAVLGDNAACEWKGKYLTDEYGRVMYETVDDEFVGIVNPEYNPEMEYISRDERPEWDAIGMVGKLYVRDDGSCVVNGYAKVGLPGVATASDERTNMRVMKRVNNNVVLILMK